MVNIGYQEIDLKQKRLRCGGFSLVELTVVILILMVLAGVSVATFRNSNEKANIAATIAACIESSNAYERYTLENQDPFGNLPDKFDSLLDFDDRQISEHFTDHFNPSAELVGWSVEQLTQLQADALQRDGFESTILMAPTTDNPTYDPGSGLLSIEAGAPYVSLDTDRAAEMFRLPAATQTSYMIVGVGNQCDLVGVTMKNAPSLSEGYGVSVPQGYGRVFLVLGLPGPFTHHTDVILAGAAAFTIMPDGAGLAFLGVDGLQQALRGPGHVHGS